MEDHGLTTGLSETEDIIRAKWTMDGAKTLGEAAMQLRRFADGLVGLEKKGWQLTQPVEDDYGYITKEASHGSAN